MSLRVLSLASLALLCGCPDNNLGAINATPEATILSHQAGDSLYEGYTVTFLGSVSDADHPADNLRVSWYLGGAPLCTGLMPGSDGSTSCQAVVEGDDGLLSLQVQDPKNAVGTDSVELLIVPNDAPTAEIVSPEASGVYTSDELITFEGVVADTEDSSEDLVCHWESNIQGPLDEVSCEPDSQGTVQGFGTLDPGDHAITLQVEDSGGKDGSASVIIDVQEPNEAPSCAITAPEDGAFGQQGEDVLLQGEVDDDGELSDLSVDWSSDRDGELGSSIPTSGGEVTLSWSELSVATHVITLWVEDERGESCTDSIVYSVGSPPSISVSSPVSGIWSTRARASCSRPPSPISRTPPPTWPSPGPAIWTASSTPGAPARAAPSASVRTASPPASTRSPSRSPTATASTPRSGWT